MCSFLPALASKARGRWRRRTASRSPHVRAVVGLRLRHESRQHCCHRCSSVTSSGVTLADRQRRFAGFWKWSRCDRCVLSDERVQRRLVNHSTTQHVSSHASLRADPATHAPGSPPSAVLAGSSTERTPPSRAQSSSSRAARGPWRHLSGTRRSLPAAGRSDHQTHTSK